MLFRSKLNFDYMASIPLLIQETTERNHVSKCKHWSNPPVNYLKINSDGSFTDISNEAGIGIVCRDYEGTFKWGFIDKVKSISAFMTEALALKKALLLALDLGYDMVMFETDCMLLKQNIVKDGSEIYEWQSRSIILEIVKLLSSQAGFSICFTPREGNGIADHLAAEAHKEVNPIGWVHTPSPLLSHLLALDVKRLNKLPRSAYDSTSQWVQDMRGVLLPSSPSSHCSGIG